MENRDHRPGGKRPHQRQGKAAFFFRNGSFDRGYVRSIHPADVSFRIPHRHRKGSNHRNSYGMGNRRIRGFFILIAAAAALVVAAFRRAFLKIVDWVEDIFDRLFF